MRRTGKSTHDEKWLKAFGEHLERLIKEKGFSSPYDFWVEEVGEEISRSSLHYILNGKSDPKLTTLKFLAEHLGVSIQTLLNF